MRVLVFGGDGMLGHQLVRSWSDRHEVWATLRLDRSAYGSRVLGHPARTLFGIDCRRVSDLVAAVGQVLPDVVVNAVGIVKQRPSARESIPSIELNALLPHRLAEICRAARARLVHVSTDCVFSGRKGNYRETDDADPVDLYGRTKFLGELHDSHCLTLRTSIIGLELGRMSGLVEWFLAQSGEIKGFRRAVYSGLTTAELARALEHVLLHDAGLSGLWHLSSQPMSKFDLLRSLAASLGRSDIVIRADDDFVCDRSLNSDAIQARTTYRVPSWSQMLEELAAQVRDRTAA